MTAEHKIGKQQGSDLVCDKYVTMSLSVAVVVILLSDKSNDNR